MPKGENQQQWQLPTYEQIQQMDEETYRSFARSFNEGLQKLEEAIHVSELSQSS